MEDEERKCPMQKGMMMSVKWCLDAQYRNCCGQTWGKGKDAHKCPYNKNFSESEFQRKRREGGK